MDLVTLAAFTFAYTVVVLVPGPGVAAIVGRALGGGFWPAVPMVIGILFGDLVYLAFAIFGLAALAELFGPFFLVVRFASAAYLLYIAWQFWTAKPGSELLAPRAVEPWWRTAFAGFALTLSNPKTIAFYLALLPTVVPLDRPLSLLGIIELFVVVTVVLIIIGFAYAGLAAWAREFMNSPKRLLILNRFTGGILAGAAAWIAVRG